MTPPTPADVVRPPDGFRRTVRLADGRQAQIAPLVPADAAELGEAIRKADAETLYRRFCGPAPRVTPQLLRHLTELDYQLRFALVARDQTGEGVAVARYEPSGEPGVAEVAVVVRPDWRRIGLATEMLLMLAEAAHERGIREFTATYLAANRPVADLLDQVGSRPVIAEGIARAVVALEP